MMDRLRVEQGDTFTCEHCERTFQCIRTDEEAMAEYEQKFGPYSEEETAILCEDCVAEFNTWYEANKSRLEQ